jgi:hypothetical protein
MDELDEIDVSEISNSELTNLKKQCMKQKEELNHRFYKFNPWAIKASEDTCQHTNIERPHRQSKAVQILTGEFCNPLSEQVYQQQMHQFKQL